MARNARFNVPTLPAITPGTLNAASRASIQNQANVPLLVMATATNVQPADTTGAIVIPPWAGVMDALLAELFPGVAGAAWLWLARDYNAGTVFVSHD